MSEEGFISRLAACARATPQAIYATFDGAPITFADLDRQSDVLAGELRRLRVGRGDRVALMMANSPGSVSLLFAIAKAGCACVPVNIQQRGDGLRYIIEHSDPRAIFADAGLVPVIGECGVDLTGRAVVPAHDPDADIDLSRMLAADTDFDEALPGPDELFAISYTSGTTGRPKGVQVTHRMLRFAAEGAILCAGARDGDVFLVWEPFYHIGGAQLLPIPLLRDIRLVMVQRFSASRFWDQVRSSGATQIHYLGGILQILLKQPTSDRDRDHKVRNAWGGGCPKDIWREFEARFGVSVRECYGMTEASSFTTYNDEGVVGAVGKPVPWLTYEILDVEGRQLAPGERGEIVVHPLRHGAVFGGYFRNPEATAKALRPTGFHTGDVGSVDAGGNLLFHGRMGDSVRVKGENVSAFEVEHVVNSHPAVEDSALIGVAAEIGEQDIKLFVKPKSGIVLDPAELSAWLGQKLAPYQNPRYLALVDEFERTPSQRIMKHRLSSATDDCWDKMAGRR